MRPVRDYSKDLERKLAQGNTREIVLNGMKFNAETILSILDQNCDDFSFPMLDNGYVYLAATRMSLYRSPQDWALVIEVFGYSPRSGLPDTHIHTFASRLHNRDKPENYVTQQAYEQYLRNNPHNESRFIHPIDPGPWQDNDTFEFIAPDATEVVVRGTKRLLPNVREYARHGIQLEHLPRIHVCEVCRYVADVAREDVLATPDERRISVLPEMAQVLQLEEWNHPDVVDDDERPSGSETFRQLAAVLVTGDVTLYKPTLPPNTHWRNWPEGGLP
jgi:hypothetical protein